MTFISSLLVFSAIVLVHEFGHFVAAKSVGIKVYEFALGMGPTLFKKNKNGTVYSIRSIPIGGFVQMEGEEEESKTSTSFGTKTVWQRFLVIFAGPLMNFLLALILFLIIAFSHGVYGNRVDEVIEDSNEYRAGLRSGDKIISVNGDKVYVWEDVFYNLMDPDSKSYTLLVERDGSTKNIKVENNYRKMVGVTSKIQNGETTTYVSPSDVTSPAYKAGIKDNDKIIKINYNPVNTWEEVTKQINISEKESLIKLTVDRNGEIFEYSVAPINQISVKFNTQLEKSFVTAIVSSGYKTIYYIELMFKTITMLLTGKIGSEAIGGPIMVISMVGEAAESGLLSLLSLAAFISINLGFMNLLPIPALDGSKIMFLLVESIRGKALPIEKEGYIHFVGFVFLIGFMIFITFKDVIRLLRI